MSEKQDDDPNSTEASLARISDYLATETDQVPVVRRGVEEVRVVPDTMVHKLDSARQDESVLQGLFFVVLGGILGFLGSFATSDVSVDRRLVVIFALLTIFAAIFGVLYFGKHRQAAALRKEILDG